ncbi:MAG: ferrochelatase [Gammaproteobacteria bacterium]|nr:ferrochelatase [Gammaproteobacteria bacterium]
MKPKIGVLLSNLGTPDAATAAAVRRYLAQFLWDRRVVDLPRPLWWLILHLIILRVRPARSARLYRKVWSEEGSPLLAISRQQQQGLQKLLDAELGEEARFVVELGMRYGNPSLESALQRLEAQEVGEIVILPLYPQNSCSTTASTFDAIGDYFRLRRRLLPHRFINHYHNHPAYIGAVVGSIEEAWQKGGRGERLILSFHGTPLRYEQEGDPYAAQCRRTAELIAAGLRLSADEWQITFQSRFGKEPWLQPYTDHTLKALAREGVRRIDIVCPGFATDCLETLEEIAGENRELFLASGGEKLAYIPALNSSGAHLEMMKQLLDEALCRQRVTA